MYMICKQILLIIFLNEPELIFCTQLNGFKYYNSTLIIYSTLHIHLNFVKCSKYCYVLLTIQLYISHLFSYT